MDVNLAGPRELPELRLHLLHQWRPKGPFEMIHNVSYDPRFAKDLRFDHLEPPIEILQLQQAELWWVTPGMSRLVRHAAESLPATTLTEELCPDRTVMAFFAEPLVGFDCTIPDREVKVDMLIWMSGTIIWDPGNRYVGISMYGPTPIEEVATQLHMPRYPLGRTDWKFGTDTAEPTFRPRSDDADALRAESMAQDRRWLAALLLLASQPVSESTVVEQLNKSKKRRLERSGYPSDVRLVDLRSAHRPAKDSDGEAKKVEWSHRWIVGEETGGFWRQQAYGPNHSLRRPKWILPFMKGPDDKPLKLRETVKIVREDR